MSRLATLLAVLLLVGVTACGGQPASDASDGTASAAIDPTAEPSAAESAADDGSDPGVGDADRYCLNTVDEVASALGIEVTAAEGIANPGLGGGCMYNGANGQPVLAISVIDNDSAADAFAGYRQYENAEEIGGIGDAALFLPMNEMVGVAFQKGSVVASIGPTVQLDLTGDALRSAVEELARQAADRL